MKNYIDEQIIEQLYKTNLIKKLIDIETINQFTIQPRAKENLEIVSNELVNTINEEKEFVNVKNEIVRYSKSYNKPKGHQWKTKIEPSSSLQAIYEYGTIFNIDSTQDLRKTIENWQQFLNFVGVKYPLKTNKKFIDFVKAPLEEPYYNSLETWNKKTIGIFKKLETILAYLYL